MLSGLGDSPAGEGRGAAADKADEHALACNAVLAELPGPRPGQLAAEAPAATAEIGPENGKADILAWLTNYLSGSLAPEAASISIALQNAAPRAETLHALIPRLPVDVLSVVLAAARGACSSPARNRLHRPARHDGPTRRLFAFRLGALRRAAHLHQRLPGPLLDYDRARETDLTATFAAYFEGGNVTHTARVIHVHVNTLLKRPGGSPDCLAQWREPDSTLRLHFAIRLHQLHGSLVPSQSALDHH
jgi:hypothetical protein